MSLLPDTERALSRYLRADAAVFALVGDRVYTAFPAGADVALPLVLVRRYGGEPILSRPLVLEAARVQIDCYGGAKKAASLVARTVQAALSELAGVAIDDGEWAGTASAALGQLRYVPDESFEPARPRFLVDAVVTVKAAGAMPPAAHRTLPGPVLEPV